MNCEEFRIHIDAAPSKDFDGRERHIAACPACNEYVAQSMALEDLITRAMNIPVPDFDLPALSDDVAAVIGLERAGAPVAQRSSFSTPAWIGLAAGLVLAIVIGLRFAGVQPDKTQYAAALAAEVLEHMVHEPHSRVVTAQPVEYSELEGVMEPAKAELSDEIGLISYARSCVINGNLIPHLVVQGEHGPVTILIMPSEMIDSTVSIENENFHGAIVPVGDGSVAIIGRKGESIDDIRSKVGNAIRLSI